MEDNKLPPAQPVQSNDSSDSLEATDANAPVSSYSLAQKTYPIENLEVHKEGDVVPAQVSTPSLLSVPFSRRKTTIVSLIITVVVLMLTGAASAFFVRWNRPGNAPTQAANVPTQAVSVSESAGQEIPGFEGEEGAVLVNGDLVTRGNLKVVSGSFASVLGVQAFTNDQNITFPDASGTICLDANNCDYVTQDQLEQAVAGVSTLNAIDGGVIIQGQTNRISVTTAGGVITITTPQDLAAISSPTFANLLLGSNLSVNGSIDTSLNCTAFANGGNLTTNANGVITCADDDNSGGSGFVTDVNSMTGSINIVGTANQVNVASGGGTITLSTPQDIAVTSSPSFTGLNVTDTANIGNNSAFADASGLTVGYDFSSGCVFGCSAINAQATATTNNNALWGIIAGVTMDGAGTISATAIAIESATLANGGSISTNYGIRVSDQTAGSSDYGIYIQGADTYALWVDADLARFDGGIEVQGTNAIILEGSSEDAFETTIAVTNPTADRTITLPNATGTVCLQGSSSCGFATGTGAAYVNGGNNFGGTGNLGLTSSNDLNILTNNATRLTVQADGDVAFDTNTLFVDAANNRVGIGTDTPSVPLHVLANQQQLLRLQNATGGVNSDVSIHLLTSPTTSSWGGAIITADRTDATGTGDTDLLFQTSDSLMSNLHMIIKHDGRVGIGTSTPTAGSLLEVNGNIYLSRESARTIKVVDSTSTDTAGAALSILGANSNGIANGGAINITSGAGSGFTGAGGALNLTGGLAAFTGGNVNITGGEKTGGGASRGGNVAITGGAATNAIGDGGAITLTGGVSTGEDGGSVSIKGGSGATAGGIVSISGGNVGGVINANLLLQFDLFAGQGVIIDPNSSIVASSIASSGSAFTFDASNAGANGMSIDVQSSSSSQYVFQATSNNGATTGLFVRADGNVGIGDATPAALFTVGDNDRFQVDASGNITFAAFATTHSISVAEPSFSSGEDLLVQAGNGTQSGGDHNGGDLLLNAGSGNGTGFGGSVILQGGSTDTGTPGAVVVLQQAGGGNDPFFVANSQTAANVFDIAHVGSSATVSLAKDCTNCGSELQFYGRNSLQWSLEVEGGSLGSDDLGVYLDGTTQVLGLSAVDGSAIFRNSADSTTALRVQNAAGTVSVLSVDTSNSEVEVDGSTILSGDMTLTPVAGDSRVVSGVFNSTFAGVGNRAAYFQTSETNGDTHLSIVANGTGTASGLFLHGTSFDNNSFGVVEYVTGTGINLTTVNPLSGGGGSINLITENASNVSAARMTITEEGVTTFNPTGIDADLSVQGDNDTNLFYVDAGNDRVGIGTSVPGNKLSLNTLTTADSAAQLAVSTNGTTNKGVIVQGVAAQSADLFQAQDSTGAVLASISAAGDLTVQNATFNGFITVNGHIVTSNTSGSTTITDGAACGAGSVSVSGNDTAGTITVTTGAGACASGVLGTVNFANAFGAAPRVTLTPANASSAAIQYFNGTANTTTFTLDSGSSPVASTTYVYNYHVIQ